MTSSGISTEERRAPGEQHGRAVTVDRSAQVKPVHFPHVTLGDGEEAGQPGLDASRSGTTHRAGPRDRRRRGCSRSRTTGAWDRRERSPSPRTGPSRAGQRWRDRPRPTASVKREPARLRRLPWTRGGASGASVCAYLLSRCPRYRSSVDGRQRAIDSPDQVVGSMKPRLRQVCRQAKPMLAGDPIAMTEPAPICTLSGGENDRTP